MIDFKNMKKEQKQKAMLGAIVALAALLALKQFVLGPMIERRARARAEYDALRSRLDLANLAIKNETDTLRRLDESKQALVKATRDFIPASDNLLAWTTKFIYSQARIVGVDIESVSETTDADISGFVSKEQTRYAFKPYGVRIELKCSFAQLTQLIDSLETNDPDLCVAGIQITAQPESPERHQVSLVIECPSWKNPERAKAFRPEGDKNA